ncbi:MAG: EAL domain-containing protein [Psychromonas sp.]
MKFNDLTPFMPKCFRRSITLKVLIYVGSAMFCSIALQTCININQMDKKVTPLVIQELKLALTHSESIFNIIAKQTREDALFIGDHRALTNYIHSEMLNDIEGMNEAVVDLEQFLLALTNFKPHYQEIEITNERGSIIHLSKGEIVKPSNLHPQLFPSNIGDKSNTRTSNSRLLQPHFTHKDGQILFTLTEKIKRKNPLASDPDSEIFIHLSNNMSNDVLSLINLLKAEHISLSLQSQNKPILTVKGNKLAPELWLSESLTNTQLNLNLSVYKEREKAFLIITNMENASLILAMGSILVISISLFLTLRFIISSPLKDITNFINQAILEKNNLKIRYETTSVDEIGIFSKCLNKMLDQIQLREQALKNSEQRLALSLWGSDEGMWELDFITNYIHLEAVSSKILRLDEKVIQQPIAEFYLMIHPEDVHRVRQYIKDFITNQYAFFKVNFRLINHDEDNVWLQLKGKFNKKNNNNFGVIGTLRDITEEIKSEEKTQLYATSFNNSNNGIAILNTDFHILAINDAYRRITGFAPEEAIGTLATFIGRHEHSIAADDINHQVYKYGYWNGEIIGKRKDKEIYVRDVDLNPVYNIDKVLTHYVCVFSDITEKKKSDQKLWEMANYDILTKLPNRGFFRKSIKRAINNSTKVNGLIALLFIDLDKFKQVNDSLGHEAGDLLLKKVAAILSYTIRKSDTASRLGGDEFAILLEGIDKKENAKVIAKKIIAEFNKGIHIQDNITNVGVSIGISFYPNDATDMQSLIHCADTAMYNAKSAGSNLFHYYHTNMHDHINRRNKIERELSIALKEGGLCLHYQPQLDMNTGKIVAFEALSRWFHPELGFIPPDEFIPIAEETGLIAELGLNVFNQACKQLKVWHEQGYTELRMAINISPKQFMLTDIHIDIVKSIKNCGIDAKYLELELTESLIIEDPEKIIRMLNTLKAIGIKLSIDDFGTGYSSLSYLSQFPLDTLKIDKSFVHKLGNDHRALALTKAIISIALSLDLEITAEGVETKEQLNILKNLGCHYMQGYYYSPAVSADKATLLLENNQ